MTASNLSYFPRHTSYEIRHSTQGQRPSERALHPRVMSFIAMHGLYGFRSEAACSARVEAAMHAAGSTIAALPVAAAASIANEAARQTRVTPSAPETIAAEICESLVPPPRKCHVVVLFGAHGVGKGAVAEALCRKHGYAHVSFGMWCINSSCRRAHPIAAVLQQPD